MHMFLFRGIFSHFVEKHQSKSKNKFKIKEKYKIKSLSFQNFDQKKKKILVTPE